MSTDDLERALRGDRRLAPSASFTARVMRAVEAEATAHVGLAFPWRRLLAGLTASVAITAAGVIAIEIRGGGGPPPIDFRAMVGELGQSGLLPALVGVPIALAGCYFVTWGSMRLAGFRR